MAWCTYPINEIYVHQQLSLHQLHKGGGTGPADPATNIFTNLDRHNSEHLDCTWPGMHVASAGSAIVSFPDYEQRNFSDIYIYIYIYIYRTYVQCTRTRAAGIESAVHSVRKLFENDTTEAIPLVDASNAFNSLNRANALMNIRTVCPAFSTILINTYRESTELFLGANTLLSQEGTTQGDPLAMPFYALATRPLIDSLFRDTPELRQIWYADDASAGGKLTNLKKWWDNLSRVGPSFGYFVNPQKTWLVTKDKFLSSASEMFDDTMVNITTDGRPVLGSPVGKPEYTGDFISQKSSNGLVRLRNLPKLRTANHMQPMVKSCMAYRVNGLIFQEQPPILITCSFLLKLRSVPHYCPS